jgi:hypothetical protein
MYNILGMMNTRLCKDMKYKHCNFHSGDIVPELVILIGLSCKHSWDG